MHRIGFKGTSCRTDIEIYSHIRKSSFRGGGYLTHLLPAVILDGMSELTQILEAAERGEPEAASRLLPLVYEELRRLAAHKLAQEQPGQTLQPTALVHEAYLRLVASPMASPGRESGEETPWSGRGHFFAAAAEAMRRILVDNARKKRSLKRGGDRQRHQLDENICLQADTYEDLAALDEALKLLADKDPLKARLVELRYFAGLTIEETAQVLGISTASAERYWAYARAWLRRKISAEKH